MSLSPLRLLPWLNRSAASVSIILLVFLGCLFAYLVGSAAHTAFIVQMVIYLAIGVLAQYSLLRNFALAGLIMSMFFLFEYNPWVTLMVAGFVLIGIVVATLLRPSALVTEAASQPQPVSQPQPASQPYAASQPQPVSQQAAGEYPPAPAPTASTAPTLNFRFDDNATPPPPPNVAP